MNVTGKLTTVALIVGVCDQLVKAIVRALIVPGDVVSVLPGVQLTHTTNTGAAFGLFQGFPYLFVVVAVGVSVLIYMYQSHLVDATCDAVLYGSIVGAAVSNALDRVLFGSVTDYIAIGWWPVFNVADAVLTIAVLILVVKTARKKEQKTTKSKKQTYS